MSDNDRLRPSTKGKKPLKDDAPFNSDDDVLLVPTKSSKKKKKKKRRGKDEDSYEGPLDASGQDEDRDELEDEEDEPTPTVTQLRKEVCNAVLCPRFLLTKLLY